jgi:hypothetical protein
MTAIDPNQPLIEAMNVPSMTRLFLLITVVVFALSGCAERETDADLRAELLEMGHADQEVRARYMAAVDLSDPEPFLRTDEGREVLAAMAAVDEKNQSRLDQVVSQYGWPSDELVGAEAASAALLIIEHSGLETKERYLPILREAVDGGQAEPSLLARLEDDVSVATTGYQIYGTKISLDTGVPVLVPIADPEGIDARRAEMGLPPMDEYLREADGEAVAEFGVAIDRSALQLE